METNVNKGGALDWLALRTRIIVQFFGVVWIVMFVLVVSGFYQFGWYRVGSRGTFIANLQQLDKEITDQYKDR